MQINDVPWYVWAVSATLGGLWLWFMYLMLYRPQLWVEWFLNKPYNSWGMKVTIVDEKRFRKAALIYSVFPLVFMVIGLMSCLMILSLKR
jgi:hypothetical protein